MLVMCRRKKKKRLSIGGALVVHLRAKWVVHCSKFSCCSAVFFLLIKYKDPPVACVVRAGIVHPYDDEHMLKVGADGLGGEGVSTRLLEHDGHYVISYVALPQQLVIGKEHGLNWRSMGLESVGNAIPCI